MTRTTKPKPATQPTFMAPAIPPADVLGRLAALKTAPPKNLAWRYDPRPEEHHNTIYHPAAGAALRWLYPK